MTLPFGVIGYIICNWKEENRYSFKDSINGKLYKNQKVAEKICNKLGYYIVRGVYE